MIKHVIAAAALVAMAGCASDPKSSSQAGKPISQQTNATAQPASYNNSVAELAAYAGSHPYPTSLAAKNDLRAAAIISSDQGTIRIYNFGSQSIREADVWVNQGFVRHVTAIAPGSSVTIPMSNFYNAVGQQLAARGEHVNLVQVDQDHDLQTLMGPAPQ